MLPLLSSVSQKHEAQLHYCCLCDVDRDRVFSSQYCILHNVSICRKIKREIGYKNCLQSMTEAQMYEYKPVIIGLKWACLIESHILCLFIRELC